MTDPRILSIVTLEAVSMDLLLTDAGDLDASQELANTVIVALGSDRRADDEEELPDPDATDRRGWWGDLDAEEIWGGDALGSKLWLLSRAKITTPEAIEGATAARHENYIREALDWHLSARVASDLDVTVTRARIDALVGEVVIYRGPKDAVALRYEDLWDKLTSGA